MIRNELKKKIQKLAVERYPNEMCGFVIGDAFIEVQNQSPDPENSFYVHPDDWREFAIKCKAFIHSHPDWYACPSESDMRQQEASDIMWGIVGTNGEASTDITFFGGEDTPDLYSRGFVHGVTDCYSAIQDWFKVNKDIELINIHRSWEWWSKGQDLYKDNFERAGFIQLPFQETMKEGPKEGDVFLASTSTTRRLNHGGVYLGRGLGYHHLTAQKPVDLTRRAKIDNLNRWSKFIHMWLRHESEM